MAAARAQTKAGGVTAIHAWLIAFVALWLVSTVLLVWLYTDQSRLQKIADDANAASTTARNEKRQAEQAMGQIAELAVGSADDDSATVASKVADLFARVRQEAVVPDASAFDDPSVGLLAGMTTMYEAYRGERDTRDQAEQRAASLAAEVERISSERIEQEEAFQQKESALVAQVQDLEGQWSQYRQTRNQEFDQVDSRIEQIEQQAAHDIQEQRTLNAQLQTERDEYESRYADLLAKLGGLQITPTALVTARQGDGVVLTAKPGENVVYVNLGRRHNITLGMAFAVYGAQEGIPADGRAKARIEVARIFKDSAECVVRQVMGRSMIVDGDIINNPIYDVDRALTFVVEGSFDFDDDGSDDPDGIEQVQALIRDWGGNVADDVTARVDFVILGNAPPQATPSDSSSPEATEHQRDLQEAFEVYEATFDAAQALSVPILTQDVFLHFLGY